VEAATGIADPGDELTLDDLDIDFDKVILPQSDKLTEQDLNVAVDSFLSTLRER